MFDFFRLWYFKRRLRKHFTSIASKFPQDRQVSVVKQLGELSRKVIEGDYSWGVFDTTTNTWIGDEKGPALYKEKDMARFVCSVAETMKYGTDLGRKFDVRIFVDYGTLRMVATEETKITKLEALKKLEEGRV